MKIKGLQIGELKSKLPIIQGGMGIGVSRSNLAAAVAREGGIGVISGVQIGYDEDDFETNTKEANSRALRREIRKAKENSNDGIIGVNFLVAMNNYAEYAKIAIEEKIDFIVSGAGIPKELPDIIKGTNTKAIPIVSSDKSANIILKLWERKNYIPDAIVIEGPQAGGHLGFHEENINSTENNLETIFKSIKTVVSTFEEKYRKKISLIVGGGISTGEDIANALNFGADGVQMGTKFIATEECDAHEDLKKMFINSNESDIVIVKSPVGLPGRAIYNAFLEKVQKGMPKITKCYGCLRSCNPKEIPYCISKALIEAVKGNVSNGLIFSGAKAYKIDKIVKVKTLLNELLEDINKFKKNT